MAHQLKVLLHIFEFLQSTLYDYFRNVTFSSSKNFMATYKACCRVSRQLLKRLKLLFSEWHCCSFPFELISRSLRLIPIELRNRLDSFSHGAFISPDAESEVVKRWSERRSLKLSHALSASHSRVRSRMLCIFFTACECKLPWGEHCWRCARRPQTEYPGAAIMSRLESVKDLVHQLIYQIGNRSEMEIDLILRESFQRVIA